MSYEIDRLMRRYGVVSPTLSYVGAPAPAGIASNASDDLLNKYAIDTATYNTDRSIWDAYNREYQTRLQNTPMYGDFEQSSILQLPVYTAPKLEYPGRNPSFNQAGRLVGALSNSIPATSFGGGIGGDGQLAAGQGISGAGNAAGQGISGLGTSIGLGLMGVPGLSTIGDAIAGSQVDAMGNAANALDAMSAVPGITTISDANGNVIGISNDASIAAADAAMGDDAAAISASANDAGQGVSDGAGSDGTGGGDGGDGGGGWAHGGRVRRHYADGGEVRLPEGYADETMGTPPPATALGGGQVLTPQLRELIMRDAAEQGIPNPVSNFKGASPGQTYGLALPTTQPSPAASAPQRTLADMLGAYDKGPSVYASELTEARKRASAESERFNSLIEQAIANPTKAAPSKAEMYFNLAAAFGAPTKTGSFFESAGKAAEVMGAHKKQEREAEQAGRAQALQLGLTAQQARAAAAKEDVSTLRTLTAEEMKDKRELMKEAVKDYLASGKPQSEAGKVAEDMIKSGQLVRGSQEHQNFLNKYVQDKLDSGDFYKNIMASVAQQGLALRQSSEQRQQEAAKKLTPGEMKLKVETEDTVASTQRVLGDLQKALKLNPNTFDTSSVDMAQRKILEAAGSTDPKVVDTREQENLLTGQALAGLRAAFGGNPTEGERKILLEVQGIGAKSREERARVIKNAYRAANIAVDRQKQRLDDIKAGRYRETTPTMPEELQ